MTSKAIGQILADVANQDPDKLAITCGGQTISRGELERRTNQLARAYESMGIREGDIVTIALPNCIEFYEATFATWKLGAIPQPLSSRLPPRERDEIVQLADPKLIVGAESMNGRTVLPRGYEPDADLSDDPLPVRVSPSLRAMTSGGSTGRPKLILSTSPSTFDPESPPMKLEPHHVSLVAGPLYHTSPFANSTHGLLMGQHIVVLDRFDAEVALRTIEQHRIKWLLLVPTMMLRMWRVLSPDPHRYDLSSIGVLWHMGAPCPIWLKEAWIDLVGADCMFELYSGTEALAITNISGSDWLQHRGSVGQVTRGEMMIVDESNVPVPPGTVGEIYMRRGEGLSAPYRYVGAEPRSLPGGWESLGDMGSIDEQGYLFIADRRTDMILSGGANIYPAEVENVVLAHPQVLCCVVVGLPDDDLGQRVHAVVQTDGALDAGTLQQFIEERLARYKVPRSFHFVNEALRDDAGKVRRSAVRTQEISLMSDDRLDTVK